MSNETIAFFGRKFFPHLTPQYQVRAVLAVLEQYRVTP